MPQSWSEIGFTVENTQDGSPSLRLFHGESMHHSGGAAAETDLIYGKVIARCFQTIPRPHLISVGLGLGYVELTVAREALLRGFDFTLESYEVVEELKSFFKMWLEGVDLPEEIQATYDSVGSYILRASKITIKDIKHILRQKLDTGGWLLRGALNASFRAERAAHGILFDAFSSKTNPELWTEDFLADFFTRSSHEDSMISTYACRGTLKRALARAHFQIQIREGFQGKRNSTLGYKGLFAVENFLT